MTTVVTVKANHGWPVEVNQTDPKTGDIIGGPQYVKAGEERDFVVHSHADLKVHEIQPNEPRPTDIG